ncbi:MAG: GntR family transcriptional regulator [Lachnospiraceae bacterium]|uniref:GntR family transcriptional regulator n=1 Tax=Lacrimispora indolis TaxID=69825 RepID=UPI003074EA1E
MIPQETMNSDEIYEDLCNKIEKLVYLPGDKISENELCRQYGVSRHIIRTVISRLKERMLLTVYPQRGTFVSLIDMKTVELILFIRESVEQEAIRLLQFEKQEVRDRMSEAMKACIERQSIAISDNIDMDAFYLLDNEFHGCLLEAVGKKDVMGIIREDYIHFRRWRNFDVVRSGRQREIIEEHTALMHALVKNETKEAHEILHMHLNTENRLRHIREKVAPEYFIYH